MSFFEELESVASEAISTFGEKADGTQMQLTWNATEIDCFEEDSESTDLLYAGGVQDEVDLVVRAMRVDFATTPKSLQTVTLNGNTYKIRAVLGSIGDPEIRLALFVPGQR